MALVATRFKKAHYEVSKEWLSETKEGKTTWYLSMLELKLIANNMAVSMMNEMINNEDKKKEKETEESILRGLIRGDTIYDVTIPENTEVYDCWSSSAPHGVFRANRIIINNPRQVDDAFAMKLYEKSKLPEKSYYAALAICVICGYINTALKILKDKVDKNNIDEVIEVFKDWHKNRESDKFIEEELQDNSKKTYERLLKIK